MKTPEPVLVADLFPEVLEALLELLSGLSADEWDKETACSGWSVKDVALHLLGGEIGNLSLRRDGHVLKASGQGWKELVNTLNDWNQDWMHAARRISPRLLVDLLEYTGTQMNDYFHNLDPFALGSPVAWVGPEPAPVWLDIAREFTERWHHQQHIRDAVGQPGLNEPRYLTPVLAAFVRAMPRAYHDVSAPEGTSVVLTLGGEAGGDWSLLRRSGEWHLFEGKAEKPNAEVLVDQDIAWRLWTRGLSRSAAEAEMAFGGEQKLGMPVLEMVSIIA